MGSKSNQPPDHGCMFQCDLLETKSVFHIFRISFGL